jgi:hypothetical protein
VVEAIAAANHTITSSLAAETAHGISFYAVVDSLYWFTKYRPPISIVLLPISRIYGL